MELHSPARQSNPRTGDLILPPQKEVTRTKPENSLPFQKTRLRGLLFLLLVTVLAYAPILSNELLWSDYDIVTRTSFTQLDSWTSAWSLESMQNEDPISLTSYFWEQYIPGVPVHIVHRILNIALHLTAAFFLLKALEALKLPGAYATTFVFTLHPVALQVLFWPGYRQELVGLALIFVALFFGLRQEKSLDYILTIAFTCLAALAHTAALVIPVILGLGVLYKHRGLKARHYNQILPVACACLFIAIWKLSSASWTIMQNDIERSIFFDPLLGHNFYFHLRQGLLPFSLDLFHPITNYSNLKSISPAPFILIAPALVGIIYQYKRTWARTFLFGFFAYLTFNLYGIFQSGHFIDNSPAFENYGGYIALPALVGFVIMGSARLSKRVGRGAVLLWKAGIGLLLCIQISLTASFAYSLHSEHLMWLGFSEKWPNSWMAKLAMLESNDSTENTELQIEGQIEALNFILEQQPDKIDLRIRLARTYDKIGQQNNALREFKRVLRETTPSDEFLEEAAVLFDSMGFGWEASNARKRKNIP